jgi:outer membrane lipoprotein-sorting protein
MLTPLCVLLLLPLALPAAPADSFQQTLARIDEAAASFKALTADVRKVHHTTIFNEDEETSGTVVVRRPRPKELQVLFNIKKPEPRQVAFSDHTVEIYHPNLMIIDVYDLDKKLGDGVSRYMLLGFGSSTKDLDQAYAIGPGGPETIDGGKTTRIVLTPKKPDPVMHLSKVELWISDETGIAMRQKLYTDPDYDVATYSNMKINPNVSESAVKLKAPEGVKKQHPQK